MTLSSFGDINQSFIVGVKLRIFAKPILRRTVTSLWCHVTYSDLSRLSVQLSEDGIPLDHGANVTGPLPNGDGTLQMRLSVEVILKSSRIYTCDLYSETVNKSVDFGKNNTFKHQLMCTVFTQTLTVPYSNSVFTGNPSPQKTTVVIVSCVAIAVCVALLIGGCCWWRQRQGRISCVSAKHHLSYSIVTFTD